jgi:hypothetical protein
MSVDKDSIRTKLRTAISLLDMAKMFIPSDKAPKLAEFCGLTSALMQTREFEEIAYFSANLIDSLVNHFANKIKDNG